MTTDKTLADFLDELTPAEQEMLMNATWQDWMETIGNLVKTRDFWAGIGQAFLQGVADGLQDFNNKNNNDF
jgi:hypothetical protein